MADPWVWLDHPDTEAPPQRFPNDPSVIAVQKARGWEQVDEPGASPEQGEVDADEVDDRGQGWVYVQHSETGGNARVPVEVYGDWAGNGWVQTSAVAALEDKKVADLKAELKERGLPTSGTKPELIDRLSEDDIATVEPDNEE
jgi:hypothetical protein